MTTPKYYAVIFDTEFKNGVYSSTAKLYLDYWESECERASYKRGCDVIEELGLKALDRGNYTCWRNPDLTYSPALKGRKLIY